MRRTMAIGLLLIMALSQLTGCSKEPVKIGFVGCLTGTNSELGVSVSIISCRRQLIHSRPDDSQTLFRYYDHTRDHNDMLLHMQHIDLLFNRFPDLIQCRKRNNPE